MPRISLLLAILFSAGVALGDVVVPAQPGAFYGGWVPSENGSQFWNHHSWDGNGCGIGFYLSGNMSGRCSALDGDPESDAETPVSYLGEAANPNAAVTDFYFTDGGGAEATLTLEVAGWAGLNSMGAYFRGPDGEILGTQLLFAGPARAGQAVDLFNPQEMDFGFFMTNGSGQTFYTESWRNPTAYKNSQQFVLFREAPAADASDMRVARYWLGVEDTAGPLGTSDRDFNDMVMRIDTVPEPLTLVLGGSALLILGLLRRSRRHAG